MQNMCTELDCQFQQLYHQTNNKPDDSISVKAKANFLSYTV